MTPIAVLLLAATAAPTPEPAPAPPLAAATSEVERPLRASFVSTSVFGVTHAKFFNQLLGARVDYRFTPRFAFGGVLSYVNLKGKDQRVHNALPEAIVEYRIPYNGESFGLPLRFGLGFLPKNGPTLRVGAGMDLAFSSSVSLELIPLETMVWVTRERPEVSFNATGGLRFAF